MQVEEPQLGMMCWYFDVTANEFQIWQRFVLKDFALARLKNMIRFAFTNLEPFKKNLELISQYSFFHSLI